MKLFRSSDTIKKILKSVLTFLIIAGITALILDVLIYAGFRQTADIWLTDKGINRYAEKVLPPTSGYYRKHPRRGFAISPNMNFQRFNAHGVPLHVIWSNQFGCYDRAADRNTKAHIYLAGDSMTWGYAPYEEKFGTILEKNLGRRVLKCGVSNIGQLHQFDKFKEIYERLVHKPSIVLVSMFENDFANDFFYPHDTAIQDILIHNTWIDISTAKVYRASDEQLLQACKDSKIKHKPNYCGAFYETKPPRRERIKFWIYRHSFLTNLIILSARIQLVYRPPASDILGESHAKTRLTPVSHHFLDGQPDHVRRHHGYKKLYERSLDAISAWNDHAQQNGYRLIVGLIHSKYALDKRSFFMTRCKAFLEKKNIPAIDSYETFQQADKAGQQSYWQYDGHLSSEGNRIYADLLAEYFVNCQDCFKSDQAS